MAKLEAGRYKGHILYHTMTVNSAGNPELRLSVLPSSYADAPGLPKGYVPVPITIFMTITPKTMGAPDAPDWVLETLRHLGFTSSDLTCLDPTADHAHSFTGKEVIILGSEDEYQGKKRVRWNILRQQQESKPIAQDTLLALSSKYADVLKSLALPPDNNAPF